jgi:hypothetical protein
MKRDPIGELCITQLNHVSLGRELRRLLLQDRLKRDGASPVAQRRDADSLDTIGKRLRLIA